MEQAKYIPGICNIGPQERVQRERVGWIGTVAFMGLAVYFHLAPFPRWANFFLFIPALAGSIGLLEYYSHFCVNFGLRGLMNLDKAAFQSEPVEQAEDRLLDRQNALKIISIGFGISIIATLVAYLIC